MGEEPDQLCNSGAAQIRLDGFRRGPRRGRGRGNNAVDASPAVAAVHVHIFEQLFGNRGRRFDELAVDIDHVEIPVRPGGEVAGTEPGVGGSQKFPVALFGGALRGEGYAVRSQKVTMDQIAGDFAGKQIAAKFFPEGVAGVDRSAGSGGEIPACNLFPVDAQLVEPSLPHVGANLAPVLRRCQLKDGC